MDTDDTSKIEIEPAVYLLLMSPVLWIVGTVGFGMVPDTTHSDLEQVTASIWPFIWVGLCLSNLLLTLGLVALAYQARRYGARLSALFGIVLPTIQAPMILCVWAVGSFLAIGSVDSSSLIYVQPEHHALVINIVEGFNDGVILLATGVLGAGVISTTRAMQNTPLAGKLLVGTGYFFGASAIVIGAALMITTQATDLFSLILLPNALLTFWGAAAGVKLLRL